MENNKVKIKLINTNTAYSRNEDERRYNGPKYATEGSAGFDLIADCPNEHIIIAPMGVFAVPTGLKAAVPTGFEMQLRPRSGLALKSFVTLLNTPGTIDSDYRGEIKVIMMNFGRENFVIKHGDRIAQGVISRVEQAEWDVVDELDETTRGEGGFGHTGV